MTTRLMLGAARNEYSVAVTGDETVVRPVYISENRSRNPMNWSVRKCNRKRPSQPIDSQSSHVIRENSLDHYVHPPFSFPFTRSIGSSNRSGGNLNAAFILRTFQLTLPPAEAEPIIENSLENDPERTGDTAAAARASALKYCRTPSGVFADLSIFWFGNIRGSETRR